MVGINGWELFAHPLFLDQLEKLTAAVERAGVKDARGYGKTANAKLLAALRQLIFETIPQDPTRSAIARAERWAMTASAGSGQSSAAGGFGCSIARARISSSSPG
jgi:DNA polymerase/3'-5' exonuclease PolX